MINLLSRDEQKKIYREYLLRIATLVFLAIGLVGAILIVVLIPSYINLNSEIASVDSKLKLKQEQLSADDQGQVAEAQQFMNEIQVLRSSGATSSAVAQIERIITLKPARIALTGFQYDVSEGKTKISIRGKADRREDLLLFKTKLETQGGFTGIELPAQTLIKRTDIQFSMDLSSTPASTSGNVSSQPSVQAGDQILP